MSQAAPLATAINPKLAEIITMLAAVTNDPSLIEIANLSPALRATRTSSELIKARFYLPNQGIQVIQNLQSTDPTIPPALLTRYNALPKQIRQEPVVQEPQALQEIVVLPPAPVFTPEMQVRRLAVIAALTVKPEDISELLITAMSKLGLKDGQDRLLSSAQIADLATDPGYWEDNNLADAVINGLQARLKKRS